MYVLETFAFGFRPNQFILQEHRASLMPIILQGGKKKQLGFIRMKYIYSYGPVFRQKKNLHHTTWCYHCWHTGSPRFGLALVRRKRATGAPRMQEKRLAMVTETDIQYRVGELGERSPSFCVRGEVLLLVQVDLPGLSRLMP
jgi:hypothetical protein